MYIDGYNIHLYTDIYMYIDHLYMYIDCCINILYIDPYI